MMSFITSLLFLFLVSSLIAIIDFINEKCGAICLLIYLTKTILGILSTVLAFSIFFINQMRFLKFLNLNLNTIVDD
jgi:hypothetical protein